MAVELGCARLRRKSGLSRRASESAWAAVATRQAKVDAGRTSAIAALELLRLGQASPSSPAEPWSPARSLRAYRAAQHAFRALRADGTCRCRPLRGWRLAACRDAWANQVSARPLLACRGSTSRKR